MVRSEFLVFEIGGDQFAVPCDAVEQAVSCESAALPDLSIVFRGQNIPVLCAHERFDLEPRQDPSGLLIVRTEDGPIALKVESISGTRSFRDDDHLGVEDVFIQNADLAVAGFFPDKEHQTLIVEINPNGLVQAAQAAKAA